MFKIPLFIIMSQEQNNNNNNSQNRVQTQNLI